MSYQDEIAEIRETAATLRREADRLDGVADELANGEAVDVPTTIAELLASHGVVSFSEDELRRASEHWPPPASLWNNVAAVMVAAQDLRDRLGVPLSVSSFWRASDDDSQHRHASAVDLNLTSEHRNEAQIDRLRMHALDMWRESHQSEGDLAGCGVYHSPRYRVHLDTHHAASKGHRYWHEDEARPYLQRLNNGEVPK